MPYAVAPWAEEDLANVLPPILKVLRGDFFCLPFGGNDTAYQGETHPPHGETANGWWTFESLRHDDRAVTLHASLNTTVRTGHVDKYITLREGHHAIYSRHLISGMSGPMNLGHHAMLKFPDTPGSGVISTSPFLYGQTAPEPVELPENQGYSLLQPDTSFTSLQAVPTITGQQTDLSRYPARKGYEDLVLLVSDPTVDLAWTAVTFLQERFVWFALKDPTVLRQTILWLSNGGRSYAPWNGRHVSVMGLEEVTSYFHYGLAPSARSNSLEQNGYATCLHLDAERPLDVRYIMAVAEIPDGFERLQSIEPSEDNKKVVLKAASGHEVTTSLDLTFLQTANNDLSS